MPTWMRLTLSIAVFKCSIISLPMLSLGADVHFMTTDEGLNNSQLLEGGQLLGFVGDVIELEPGSHVIAVPAQSDYVLILQVMASDQYVDINAEKPNQGCMDERREITWMQPILNVGGTYDGVTDVVMAAPTLGAKTTGRDTTECDLHPVSNFKCTPQYVALRVNSSPEGAEVWIDGELQQYFTNDSLSIEFCPKHPAKSVLLRMSGKVTCPPKTIENKPGGSNIAECQFRDLIASSVGSEEQENGSGQGQPDPGAIILEIPESN